MGYIQKTGIFVAVIFSMMSFTTASHAASPFGTWVRDNGVHINVYSCKGGLGMKIVKASRKENVGKVIMCGAKTKNKGQWKGELLNVEDGKTYTGIVSLEGVRKLKLEGCILGGLICKSDIWNRL